MTSSPSPGLRKVNSMLLHEVAEVVRSLKDPRLGFVTITGVDTTPDLRTARAYYSVLGSAEESEACAEALEAAAGHVRGEIGHRVRMRYTPAIIFAPDHSIEEGAKISNLLREIARKDKES